MAILLAVIERDGSSQIGGKVLQTIDDRLRHFLRSASGKFFEEGEAQNALLEYHQRAGASSADGDITFPVTILAAIGDVHREVAIWRRPAICSGLQPSLRCRSTYSWTAKSCSRHRVRLSFLRLVDRAFDQNA